MTTKYEAEIVRLHRFFVDWFTGQLPQTREAFTAFSDSMASGFAIIGPDGRLTELPELARNLYNHHGNHEPQTFDIEIKNVVLRRAFGRWAIVTYEEWQRLGEQHSGRLSTVVLEEELQIGRLEWLHVHETWLPVS